MPLRNIFEFNIVAKSHHHHILCAFNKKNDCVFCFGRFQISLPGKTHTQCVNDVQNIDYVLLSHLLFCPEIQCF